jgi:two-component system cell cycle sensor histidine kinase/response regulator CckA
MSLSSYISVLLIAGGAAVMAVCIRRFGPAVRQLKRVSEKEYLKIKPLANFNRALMVFFLVGYLAVALSIVLKVRIIGEYFVGTVFFFGAVFVLLGIVLQSKMTASLKYRFDAAMRVKEALETERKNLSVVNERLNAEISERLQAENALTSAKAFLQNIIDSMPEQIMVINRDCHVALVNRTALAINGMDVLPEGIHCHRMSHLSDSPCSGEEHLCPLNEVLRTGKQVAVEHNHRDAAGKLTVVEILASPIFNESGEVCQVVESCRDITARRQAEEKLREMQKMEAIATLAGGIAHDFNNILAAIMGNTEICLLDVPQEEKIAARLENILQASHRARELVAQILSFKRSEAGEVRPLEVGSIVKETLKLLRPSIPATIDIIVDVDADAGLINADATQIHQIIMNLCTNAAHAMREDGGTLTLTLTDVTIEERFQKSPTTLPAGAYIRLRVTDTGAGMDEHTLGRIFEPYFTTKEKGEGTGLGLYVVHGIVQQFNGWMDVTSIPGQGTTFTIYFPKIEAAAGTLASAANVHPTGRETVLLVDDDAFIVEMTGEMLTGLGYRVFPVTSAAEALKAFEEVPDRFDLVITDQTMPEMTGDKLVHCLRKIKPRLPAIVCSGYSEHLDSRKAREYGIDAFLMKPVERSVLAQTVRRVLDDNRISFEPPPGASINPGTASPPNAANATAAACELAGPNGCP